MNKEKKLIFDHALFMCRLHAENKALFLLKLIIFIFFQISEFFARIITF